MSLRFSLDAASLAKSLSFFAAGCFALALVACLPVAAMGQEEAVASATPSTSSPSVATREDPRVATLLPRPAATDPSTRAALYMALGQQVDALEKRGNLLKTVARLICPTVVHIESDTSRRSTTSRGGTRQVEEAGSGVIIQWKGQFYVLTNGHVIRNAVNESVRIHLADGRVIHPDQRWIDPAIDAAVLRVSATDLVAAPLGNSDKMEIGDFVLAVGSPFGLSHSVTYGIISAKGRRDLELGNSEVRFQDFLQTDAAINPGNSGGPLINLRGEVIGINTAIASNSGGNEGIGFTIPINMFFRAARQLIEDGTVNRAFLGVVLDSKYGPSRAAEAGLSRPVGARITQVTADSPAHTADLHVGDIILQFDDIQVEDDNHLVNLVSMTDIGHEVSLKIVRDRLPITVRVAVGDRKKFNQ